MYQRPHTNQRVKDLIQINVSKTSHKSTCQRPHTNQRVKDLTQINVSDLI